MISAQALKNGAARGIRTHAALSSGVRPSPKTPRTPAFPRNFCPVPPGRLLPFLQSVVASGRRTVQHRGSAAVVLKQTQCLRQLSTVRGDTFWLPLETTRARIRRKNEMMARFWDRRAKRRLQQQPCWRGEPRPADYGSVPVGQLPTIDEIVRLNIAHLYWSSFYGLYRPEEPKPELKTPSAEEVTAEIAKHRWPDSYSFAVFARVMRLMTAADAAERYGVVTDTLYRYCSLIRKGLGVHVYYGGNGGSG